MSAKQYPAVTKLLLTCEHGGNQIPNSLQSKFNSHTDLLNSHKGYDLGSLDLFSFLKPLSAFSLFNTTSRLVIDFNRSLGNPKLFSEFTKSLTESEKIDLLEGAYWEYRTTVSNWIQNQIESEYSVRHISVHSFTPELNGKVRNADITFLYDPQRVDEKKYAGILAKKIREMDKSLKVRMNYPYKGISDGLTSALRKIFKSGYVGIELEVNQKWSQNNRMDKRIKDLLQTSILELLNIENGGISAGVRNPL